MFDIIPAVKNVTNLESDFVLTSESSIICDESSYDLGILLSEYLSPATGFILEVKTSSPSSSDIQLILDGDNTADEEGFFDERYHIKADKSGLILTGVSLAGIARGIQLLRQLFPVEIFSSVVVESVLAMS